MTNSVGILAANGARIAPLCKGVLKASYMRKWMSERLKRRKKAGDGSPSTKEAAKAPEPLQPRFYDDEPGPPVAVPTVVASAESLRSPKPASEAAPETASATAATSAASVAAPGARATRRRRSRGGRGRSRPRATAAEPSADKAFTAEPSASETSASEVLLAGQLPADAEPVQVAPEQTAPLQPTLGDIPGAMPDQVVATRAAAGVVAAPARASKGTVVLAIGLPGSGKSSWFNRHNIHPLSSDLLRELLFDDAQEQRFQDLVFSNLRSMLKARLIARRPMNYVDATNLTPHDRHSWIKLAKDYGYDVQGVFFDVPLEVCMERHQRRGRSVPEDIMRKMAGKLKPPTFDEGFSKITVVRVKQKEAAAG